MDRGPRAVPASKHRKFPGQSCHIGDAATCTLKQFPQHSTKRDFIALCSHSRSCECQRQYPLRLHPGFSTAHLNRSHHKPPHVVVEEIQLPQVIAFQRRSTHLRCPSRTAPWELEYHSIFLNSAGQIPPFLSLISPFLSDMSCMV